MPRSPSSNPPRTLLLDWDNTLHDGAGTFLRALRTVLAPRGIEVDAERYRAAYDPDYRVLYARLGVPERNVSAISDEWRRLVADAEPRLLPGARAALDRLRAAGIRLAVVTAAPRDQVERQLALLGPDWLPVVVAGDEAAAARPDPAPLRLAIDRLDGAHAPIAYAGDTAADVAMGRAAGVWSIGIAGFAASEDELRAAGADETAPSLAALADRWLGVAG